MPNPSHNKTSRAILAGCCLVFLIGSLASSNGEDWIFHLTNGDRLTGGVLVETATEVTLTNSLLGKVTLPLAQVKSREKVPAPDAPAPAAAPAPAPAPAQAPAVPAAPESASVPKTNAPPAAAVPAPAKIEAEKAAATPPPVSHFRTFLSEWKGDVQLGANLVFSTKERETFSGRMKATHSTIPVAGHGQMRHILDYNVTYGMTDGVLSDNQMDGSWKTEYDIWKSKRFHLYNAVGAGYNEIQSIDLRYDLGPGVGYKLIVTTNYVLSTEIGGNFQRQNYSNGTQKERFAMRFAEYFTWQITPRLKFDEKIEYFPQIEDFGSFRVRAEGSLSYLLRNNLTFTLNLVDIYDTSLPVAISRNDLQIRSLFGIKF